MHKRDYFLKALQAGCYKYKQWVIEAFSITENLSDDTRPYPYALSLVDGRWQFLNPETGQINTLEGTFKGEPALVFKDEMVIGSGEIANVKENMTTTYGNVLFNQLVLVYAFGDKIPFAAGQVSVSKLEKVIEKGLLDDSLTISEYKRFNESIHGLVGFSQLCVPSATMRSLTTDPAIRKRRAELFEQFKDQLQDPVVRARIDNELIAMDRAWLKGDDSEGYYFKSKSFDVIRKKTFITQGMEEGFGVKGELVPTSLDEGWDPKYLPSMGNALRTGSYSRGALTALGGEAVKFNYRIFQNSRISEEDCGSTLGMPVSVTERNVRWFIGNSVLRNEQLVEITEENHRSFIGKQVSMRSPIYCKTGGSNFCAVCAGKNIANTPDALAANVASFSSAMMRASLKKMHGSALQTVPFRIDLLT